jgi:hypothetical protein
LSLSKGNNSNSFDDIVDRISILRIAALWAFSESAFGGILHALTLPLRGLFIASAAVLFISLIALFSKNSKEILKATLIVILIKAVVSPHSPLTAYFAVALQGLLGFLFFSTQKLYRLSALLLGIFVLFLSGIQKIVVLTILFGTTLWQSLDIFIKEISNDFFNISHPEINYGYILIAGYVLIHLVAGVFIGFYAGKLPQKINHYSGLITNAIINNSDEEIPRKKKLKKKSWFLRPSGIFVLIISMGLIALSYLSPDLEESIAISVIIMLVRALIITIIWYTIATPLARKFFERFVRKRKSAYARELEEIISMFPKFRKIVNHCWKNSENKKGFKRIRYFLSTSFYFLLLSN